MTTTPPRDERGMTLIEIAMVMLILGILLPIIATFLLSTQHSAFNVTGRGVSSGEAQLIDETLARQIHAANLPLGVSTLGAEIITATTTELEVYSSLGGVAAPDKVDIKVVAACSTCTYDNLQETVYVPTVTVVGGNTTATYPSSGATRILATGVVVPASPGSNCPSTGTTNASTWPVFEYFDTDAGAASPGTCETPAAASYPSIDSVTVDLTTVDPQHTQAAKTSYSFTFSMPNIDYKEVGA